MLTMFSLCDLSRGREGHKLEREIQKIQRGPRSYFWSINFLGADSSLLSLEAMFSFSPAWHVVKDRLHYALNSLESCTFTKELWRIAKWLCPAGSRLHTSTPTVAAAARTSNRKLQQISRIDELQMSGLNEINSASLMCCSDKLLKMMHGSGRTHAQSSLRRPAMGKFV